MKLLMLYVNRTYQLAKLYRNERFKKSDLNSVHHMYIITLCSNPGISQEKLAKKIFVNKSNVARQLSLLEDNGYVERRPDERDKRQMLVYPTEKAHEVYPAIIETLNDWNNAILEGFSKDEQEALIDAMEKIMHKSKSIVASLNLP